MKFQSTSAPIGADDILSAACSAFAFLFQSTSAPIGVDDRDWLGSFPFAKCFNPRPPRSERTTSRRCGRCTREWSFNPRPPRSERTTCILR